LAHLLVLALVVTADTAALVAAAVLVAGLVAMAVGVVLAQAAVVLQTHTHLFTLALVAKVV
jgi:hypothetical protein